MGKLTDEEQVIKMNDTPNVRDAECCGNCPHRQGEPDEFDEVPCTAHGIMTKMTKVCDSFLKPEEK